MYEPVHFVREQQRSQVAVVEPEPEQDRVVVVERLETWGEARERAGRRDRLQGESEDWAGRAEGRGWRGRSRSRPRDPTWGETRERAGRRERGLPGLPGPGAPVQREGGGAWRGLSPEREWRGRSPGTRSASPAPSELERVRHSRPSSPALPSLSSRPTSPLLPALPPRPSRPSSSVLPARPRRSASPPCGWRGRSPDREWRGRSPGIGRIY